ncbi:MAG: hypothetical protein JKX75_04065 [Gammaproteobacteria bacterium]|nr:hypothetical protein [Gammaproteobacteria bacterium]
MKHSNNIIFYSLFTLHALFAAHNVYAENENNKRTYKVDFNNTPSLHNTTTKTTNNTSDDDLKIYFFNGGRALLLNPNAIPNTKIIYQDSATPVETSINTLEEHGVEFIVCDKDAKKNLGDIIHTPKSSTISSGIKQKGKEKIAHLESLGYTCGNH